MTLQELNQLFELRERLAKAQEMIDALRTAACPGAQVITGMPHTSGVKDKVGDLAVEIADMDERISYLEGEIERVKIPIVEWIKTIDDEQTRLIFRLRFVRGMAWKEVASVMGGNNTAANIRSICYRYLESCSTM
ncbi:MAG: hypothetical protein IJ955_06980 [Oscillospiraceae bacterium]|nr:hypothetical protein [Oscillospiraceae bacterium]